MNVGGHSVHLSISIDGMKRWFDSLLAVTAPNELLREGLAGAPYPGSEEPPSTEVSSLSLALFQMGLIKHLPEPLKSPPEPPAPLSHS